MEQAIEPLNSEIPRFSLETSSPASSRHICSVLSCWNAAKWVVKMFSKSGMEQASFLACQSPCGACSSSLHASNGTTVTGKPACLKSSTWSNQESSHVSVKWHTPTPGVGRPGCSWRKCFSTCRTMHLLAARKPCMGRQSEASGAVPVKAAI